jgi:pyruvate formate lyase activating enzyme
MKSAVFTYSRAETTIDFEGHIALLMFTRGCNFRCSYCHNPELMDAGGENMGYDELGLVLSRARENWVDGICITGGEPLMQKEMVNTSAFIKKTGLALKIDTQGSFPDALSGVLPHCDYVAMDYKMPAARYREVTNLEVDAGKIRQSLKMLVNGGMPYEVRTTIVPGIHSEEHIRSMCRELVGVRRYVLQAFIPRDNLPDEGLRHIERTPITLLEQYAEICREYLEEVVIR